MMGLIFSLKQGGLFQKIKRRLAFTLSEILLTLVVIGIVAALTIPAIVQNIQKQGYVSGLQTAQNIIQGYSLINIWRIMVA
ncbi:MAG: type II secretion system GspH family protein [Desulfobacterales bacterium]|nr:type II secretion system GspH family protein [Desulfobacterales bacterium]